MFVLAYAFLTTYQAYYLLDKIGTAKADVPQQIFLGTLVQSAVVVAASLIGGKVSDRTGRRKIFVLAASVVYGLALFVIAVASSFSGFLVGMAISGLGFGVYAAVDLALVVDVLPDRRNAAKDLGVFNIAGALPFPSRQGSRRPSWPSVTAAMACCTGRRALRHHRSRRHLARPACPVSARGAARTAAGPPREGPAVRPAARQLRRGRRAMSRQRPSRS